MFARIFDKEKHRYYKSIVYCRINHGYYLQYVVVNPYTDCFELVDYLDNSDDKSVPLVEIIQADDADWTRYESTQLLKYKAYCEERHKEIAFNFLWGYSDVCENFDFLTAIQQEKSISVSESDICIRSLPDCETWNYILTQDDADAFMKAFVGFHDSTLEKVTYEETPDETRVTAVFDNRSWYGIVELCFEGVLAINIRPAKENYSREIYEATLKTRDEAILWADWYMEKEDLSYDGSYIKALSLKWRKIE